MNKVVDKIRSKIQLLNLEEEAKNEVYLLIDEHHRPLPKKKDGTIDEDAEGFQHNDVDALRHAYVSGVFTMEYSVGFASFLGGARETFSGSSSVGNLGIQAGREGQLGIGP